MNHPTNADHAAEITKHYKALLHSPSAQLLNSGGLLPEYDAYLIAAAVLSAPGVVDLDPKHTAEILTWALRIAALSNIPAACPPHVAEALRKVTTLERKLD